MTDALGKNPYRPGAATPPLYLAGREPELRRFARVLDSAPELPANVRLTGLRGVGKSVLLKEFEATASSAGWAAVRVQLEPRHNSDAGLAELVQTVVQAKINSMSMGHRVRARVAGAIDSARRLITVSYEDLTVALAGSLGGQQDLAKSLYEAVNEALDTGHEGFVLLLDEAQVVKDDVSRNGEHPLSMLIAATNTLQEAGLPLGLVLCGLPTLGTHLQKARTYSERMFRAEHIGPLTGNPGPARDAFTKPLEGTGATATEGLIQRVIDEVEGYPFFIQLWGAELWEAARSAGLDAFTVDLLDVIEPEIYARLDKEFYAGRVEALTPSEQDLLLSTALCSYPPLRTPDIRVQNSKSEGNINVLMGRLAEQGVIYRVQKGIYEYTAPKFHEYLVRRLDSR